jgi:antitoxin (DNA-binding transcriptional repressor) of toxin-antitoxin stability system
MNGGYMRKVSMHEAGAQLSALIDYLESKKEDEIIITRDDQPVARLMPIDSTVDTSARIGIAKNIFVVPDDIDVNNEKIVDFFS